jgi:DNA-binding MarR family transcriptional regulator
VTEPRLRFPKVDPYAICDLAREERLTATEAWTLHLLSIQAEFRSSEWAGTLTDLAAATRLSRKTAAGVVDRLVAKDLLEVIEPFRQGTDGRVRVTVHSRLVNCRGRSKIAQFDANSPTEDRDEIATSSRRVRDGFGQSDAIDQGKGGLREVRRHGGGGGVPTPPGRCRCGDPMEGHPFDHEPALDPDSVETNDDDTVEFRVQATRP